MTMRWSATRVINDAVYHWCSRLYPYLCVRWGHFE